MTPLEVISTFQALALCGIWFRLGGVLMRLDAHEKRLDKVEEQCSAI